MAVPAWKRVGVSLTAAAVAVGVAGCQGGDRKAADGVKDEVQWSSATQVIQAAYKKTAEAKTARVKMTISTPEALGVPGAGPGAGDMEMSGVMGWAPAQLDLTMKGGFAAAGPDGAQQMRMVMLDNITYMDMGKKAAARMGGKRWIKMDFAAMAEMSGDKGLQKAMTADLENMNQGPAKQLALLLESPNLKHVGREKVDGVDAQHYKGTLSVDEMIASNKSLSTLPEKDREQVLATVKKAGITAYDTEVWVNEDGYPVKMDVGMKTARGTMEISATYSDYGIKAAVQAPPAGETVDFLKMIEDMTKAARENGGA
ncbi:hypothetical protein ACFPM3_30290 [Streptomyces coeruleoprunus]|uniref:Lipoprotein n=1 Tax=Streptomyces coeruleoprunus TaxID=285563 RepID=A0ABV9XPK5_9ACTN